MSNVKLKYIATVLPFVLMFVAMAIWMLSDLIGIEKTSDTYTYRVKRNFAWLFLPLTGFMLASGIFIARLGRIATARVPSTLFEEIATMFASALSAKAILDFSPSPSAVDRASELLELNRANGLDEASRAELDQYEQGELLMRLVKARIRANQSKDMPDDE